MTDTLITELTRDEILDLADIEGKKLGFLLAMSPFDENTQRAILHILKDMNIEQMTKFVDLFESEYFVSQNQDLNFWLKTQLENIRAEAETKQRVADMDVIAKIKKLEEQL